MSDDKGNTLVLRGHHLLCLLGFRGRGYSLGYVRNMSRVVGELLSPDEARVEVSDHPDDICKPCPHLGEGGCHKEDLSSESRVVAKDRNVLAALGLGLGDELSWSGIQERIRAFISPSWLEEVCSDCEWFALGYCIEGLEKLRYG